ncbi:nebulosa [Carabus blaptoides fortunei]
MDCGSQDCVVNVDSNEKQPRAKCRLWFQAFIVLSATFSNLSDGMGTGWTSTAVADMMSTNGTLSITIDSNQAALIGTLPMYAIFCSAPVSIYSANKIGRKWTILWGCTLTCISWICLSLVATDVATIYAAAFLRGFGGSVIFTIIPMYSAEIAHVSIRGLLGSFVPAMMNIGVLLSYVTTIYLPLWVTATVAAVAAFIVWPLFSWAPQSPYYILVSSRDRIKAREALCKLQGDGQHIDTELSNMEVAAAAENLERENAVPILELVTIPANRKVTFIVVTLQFIQQLTGVDAILIFLEFILEEKNSSIIFGVGKLVSCLLSLVLIDRLGRKPLLVFSCVMSCLTLVTLGGYFYVKDALASDVSAVRSWLPLGTLVLFICCYNVGLGIVPFILGGEMYPTRIKALGVTFGEVMYALPMIIATEVFSRTREAYGLYFPIWLFAGFSFLGAIFCLVFVIETKGKTLQDIQRELKQQSA